MFKTLFATLLSLFWLFSASVSVFYATEVRAQQAAFVKFDRPKALPAMVVQDVDGKDITLRQLLRQKATNGIVLLHLWSPSCRPCVKEICNIDKAKAALSAKGMPIISLAEDPRGAFTVPAFIRRQDIEKEDIYIDKNLHAMKSLQAPGVPITYIVSDKGFALAAHTGTLSW